MLTIIIVCQVQCSSFQANKIGAELGHSLKKLKQGLILFVKLAFTFYPNGSHGNTK